MRTFSEAIDVLQHGSEADKELKIENLKDIAREVSSNELAHSFVFALYGSFMKMSARQSNGENGVYFSVDEADILSLMLSAFASGVRVGCEMEKQDLPV